MIELCAMEFLRKILNFERQRRIIFVSIYYNNNKYNNKKTDIEITRCIRLNLGIFLSVFSFGRRRSEGSRASLDFDVAVEERRGVGSDGDGFVEFAEIGENTVEGRSAFSEDDALVLRGSREEFVEGSRLRKEDEIGAVPFTYQANLRRRELSEHSFGGVCSDERFSLTQKKHFKGLTRSKTVEI